MVELLLAKGADINKRSLGRNGATALHLAVHGEHIETVKVLLAANADPLLKTQSGQTLLDLVDDRDSPLAKLVEAYYSKALKEVEKKRLAGLCSVVSVNFVCSVLETTQY